MPAGGQSVQSVDGPRMRLNVNALVDDEVVGKFLVVVGEEASMDSLVDKVQRTLHRGDISSSVEKVLNSSKAVLPHDEFLGDMLRDGEEIFVELRGQDGQLMRNSGVRDNVTVLQQHQQPPSFGASPGRGNTLPMRVELTAPEMDDGSDDELEVGPAPPTAAHYPPPPATLKGALGNVQHVPGPSENFEMERVPYDVVQVDHPCDPIQPGTYDNDWLVESLSPHLRNFVLEHFQEDFITEPKYVASIGKFVGPRFYQACGSFISVFMRPQTTMGSDPTNTMPVHYNIAKADLLTFQRKAEAHIQKAQQHLDLFTTTMRGLQALLQKGMSETDHICEMLPHSYPVMDEVEGAMIEMEKPIFPKMEGSHPIIIVDTSGSVGSHLMFVKAALKRALYAHMGDKMSFQLIRFHAAGGEPRLWMQSMVPPVDDALCSAETWIDNLVPVASAKLVNGLRYAMSHQDCDAIYLISSADLDPAQHEALLANVRHLNTREVQISTIGINPGHVGELLLRNLAESNHGDFLLKAFSGNSTVPAYCADDMKWTSWRTNLVNEKSKQLSDSFKKQKMTIGSQVRIIEVMQREERQKEESWREEWKCTQRLLLSADNSKRNGTVMGDRDLVRELERKGGRTLAARVGGGFMWHTEELDLGLERLFEHQSAVPWTANSDTAATGPKVPCGAAGQGRVAKFPPGRDTLPEAVLPMPERRFRPRSAGYPSASATNPWATPGNSKIRKLPPMQISARKQASARAPSPGGGSRAPSPSGPRAASADRAAGDRQPSPMGRKARGSTPRRSQERQTGRKARTPTASPSPSLRGSNRLPAMAAATMPRPPSPRSPRQPRLERRWSF